MLTVLLALLTAIPLPSKPDRYVTDAAHVLPADRAEALNGKLAQFERDTSDQVLVYVADDLPEGTTLEEMSSEALHQWHVGQKGKDNGAILFVFMKPHLLRIETGYGLEASLTDAKARRITSTVMKPLLQQGDAAGAIEQGTEAMLAAIRGEDFRGSGTTATEANASHATGSPWIPLLFFFGVFGFIAVMATVGRRRGWVTSGLPTSSDWTSSDSSSSSSWSSDSSFSDSSSSSDSFSGGGGDGGGGGSSDSW